MLEPPARASSSANNANDGSTHLLKVSNLIQAQAWWTSPQAQVDTFRFGIGIGTGFGEQP